MWGSASTDERVFQNPLQFDLDRREKRAHYTFGLGLHHCVGSYLARAELNTAVKSWLQAFKTVSLAVPQTDIHYEAIFGFRALAELPVIVTR
jgi:cytochrome P450